MRIAVSGGGNIGTCFAAHMAECGHEVTVHTSKPELFSDTLFVEAGESGSVIHKGRIRGAFKDPKEAFSEADLVFLTVPAFLFEERLSEMKPYLKQDAAVFFVPGSGGGEGFARKLTGEKRTVFGLQRVPAIARLKEYGKTVVCTGYRRELAVSAMPISEVGKAKELMEELFQIPCRILPNFLNLLHDIDDFYKYQERMVGLIVLFD